MDADFILALQLQEQFDIEHESASLWPSDDSTQGNVSNNNNNKPTTMTPWGGGGGGGGPSSRVPHTDPERPLSIVDESWETLDPSPDVRAMFLTFNDRFFWGKLSGVEVKWSPRMTLCAGVCSYEGRGGLCSIRLSAPLLKLRPRRDLVETLLHEMIHALLFVTQNNRDRDGHGPEFCKHMNRINTETGTKISIYHSFNDEVDVYRTHWWRCDGPCQNRKPFLGYVKRAMNRAPSATDPWWADHRRSCGGTFVKVKEPEGYKKKGKAVAVAASGKDEKNTPETQAPGNAKSSKPTTGSSGSQDIRSFIPFSGKGLLLGGNSGPSTSNASSSGGDHLPKRPLQSPAFSPKKPLFSPSSQTNASPSSLQGRLGSPVKGGLAGTSPWNRTGPSSKVPKKRSVGNTRYFTNVNGSPVKLAKPLPRTSIPSGGIRGRGDPRTTTKGSIADIFNRRTLKTSSPSAMVSKPPDEATGAAPSSSSNRNSSSAGSESSLSTATATTPKPSFITVKKEGSNHPSVFPTASKPSSATQTKHSFIAVKKEGSNHPSVFPTVSKPSSATVKKESSSHPSVFPTVSKPSSATVKKESSSHPSVFPTPSKPSSATVKKESSSHPSVFPTVSKPSSATQSKPSFITVKKEDSHHPSLFPTASKLNPAKPNRSDHSEHADRGAGAGPASRKRPLDDSADLVSFLREALSPTSPEVKRPRVSSPSSSSARASSAVVAETPISSSRQASSTSTNSSSSSSNPSVPSSTSGPHITGAASSSAVSCPVCQAKVHESKINEHLDSCLSWQHLN